MKRTVPLALALCHISHPSYSVSDTLSKFSHDNDMKVAMNAILGMGLIGAGTNNSRLSQMLRALTEYYAKEPDQLFVVRIAMGLLHASKGLVTLNPFHSDRLCMSNVAAAGLFVPLVAAMKLKETLLDKEHYLLYTLALAMRPRILVALDTELKPLATLVRVGQAVDNVGKSGSQKGITGFQTHNTPVLMGFKDRVEMATQEYIPLQKSQILEGFVIMKKNPDYTREEPDE